MRVVRSFLVLGCSYLASAGPLSLRASELSTFEQIAPSKKLTWTPCYTEQFQCARLELPMDYNRPSGPKVSLPLIKMPAQDNSTDGPYQGMLLFNPGGPGSSGVRIWLEGAGGPLQQIAGTNWDFVSFDPRGVGYATPSANCSDAAGSKLRRRDQLTGPKMDARFLNASFDHARQVGQQCQQKIGGEDQIGSYMSTASAATDMLMLAEAFAETEEGKKAPNNQLVNYWGFSYGSILGITFASMYPDRVGRVVLDAQGNPDDWVSSDALKSITSLDDVIWNFFKFCHLAGPSKCSFATGNSAHDVYRRFENMLWRLDAETAFAENWKNASDISESLRLLQQYMYTAVFNPKTQFPVISDIWVAWEKTINTNFSAEAMAAAQADVVGPPKIYPGYMENNFDWLLAIQCTDADSNYGQSMESLQQYINYAQSEQQSAVVGGEYVIEGKIACANWPMLAKWRFTGPFEATTKTPMQFMGNTFDPATPITNTQDNLKRFSGSKLITVDDIGHGTPSASNKCSEKAAHSYFQTGIPVEKFCDFEIGPWNVTGAGPLTGQGYYKWDSI